jgi:hypothetical protein
VVSHNPVPVGVLPNLGAAQETLFDEDGEEREVNLDEAEKSNPTAR